MYIPFVNFKFFYASSKKNRSHNEILQTAAKVKVSELHFFLPKIRLKQIF